MRLTGAEIVARALIEQGATTVFGYPGGAVLAIYDALFEHRNEIAHYLTAHEQGAAHAADGYARATGNVGVVLATSGPGSTNLVTGIATAFMDSVPLVVITGNVGSTLIGKDSFQEVYTTGITLPITKHNFFVQDVGELASVLREAFAIAADGRQGPVLVDITKDAQAASCEWEPALKSTTTAADDSTTPTFTQEDIDSLLAEISGSLRPLVIFGGGVLSANASTELNKFIHLTRIPAVHSIMGTGVLDADNPLNIGLVGMHGKISGNRALAEADLIIALGFRFSDRVALNAKQWASQARIIQIDIDPSEVDKNIEVDRAIIGDVRGALQAFLEVAGGAAADNGRRGGATGGETTGSGVAGGTDAQNSTHLVGTLHATPLTTVSQDVDTHSAWLARIEGWRADDYQPKDSDVVLKSHQIIKTIADLAGPDAIFTTDVGQHQMWAAQFSQRSRPRSFLTSGGLGAMGFGYGAAIGAQIGAGGGSTRTRPVVHITGDGSFHMNLNEACTAVSYRLPIITVIFNNQVLGMVRQWQHAFYDAHYSATTLDRVTDYVKVAEGFGATGMRATTIEEFYAAFARALTIEGPVWIECVVDRDEQVLPMIPVGGGVEDTIID